MITRQPQPGEWIEYQPRAKPWEPFGRVIRSTDFLTWCEGKEFPFWWRFGTLGNNGCFRIAAPAVTMEDPAFN